MKTKNKGVKLLAAVAMFAMVVCAFATIMPAEEVQGDDTTTSPDDSNLGLRGTLESDYTIVKTNYLSNNLVIKEGATLTVASTGTLDLNGYSLTIEGNLVVNNGGTVIAKGSAAENAEKEGIILAGTGSITNNGNIGKGEAVSVYGINHGEVSIQNVTGISFGLNRVVGTSGAEYTLTFSGTAVKNGTGTNKITAAGGAIVSGQLSIGSGVIFAAENVVVSKSSSVTVNGTVSGEIELQNGATLSLNGKTDVDGIAVKAKTGEYISKDTASSLIDETSVTVKNVSGIVFSVASESYMDDKTSMTEQKLLLSGNAIRADTKVAASIEVSADGIIYVVNSLAIAYNESTGNTVSFTLGDNTKIVVTGEISSAGVIVAEGNEGKFVGTGYSVTSESQVTTYYVTGFDDALSQIANAVGKTITVYGNLEIADAKNLSAGQTIDINNANVEISENGSVELASEAVIDGTVVKVEGKLTVLYGALCSAPTTFAVKTSSTNGDVTYSGLAIAISEANEGDTINVVNEAEVSGSLTIPAGITVDVNASGALGVEKNLTVNGTLDNHGTVDVGRNVTVSGKIDNTEGTKLDLCTDTGDYTVTVSGTGSIVFPANTTPEAKYNGAYFTDDEGYTVLTTLSNAADSVADYDVGGTITVIGKVTENADVTTKKDIELESGAVVNANITLDDCTLTISKDAEFTGIVTGQSGEDGSTVASAVSLNKVKGLTVASSDSPNDANVIVWTMSIAPAVADNANEGEVETLVGGVTVSAGTVTLNSDLKVDSSSSPVNTLAVSEGATLVIPDEVDLTATKGVSVKGTVVVDGTVDAVDVTVAGTMNISTTGTVNVTKLNVTGTVNVETEGDDVGTLEIGESGSIIVGKKPTSLGSSATGAIVGTVAFKDTTGMIKAYAGADMSKVAYETNVKVVSTEYQINDTPYMTVYATSGNSVKIVETATSDKISLSGFVTDDMKWTDGKTAVGEKTIGSVETVYAEVELDTVNGIISVGTGMTMYIDGLTIANWYAGERFYLTVGTHTITIAANNGYTIDKATITFNGQTVQNGGTITVDADATSFTLAATGAAPANNSVIVDGGNSGSDDDDGLGLTDILLIVLVVLIAVMAVMVALRLMRS